MSRRNRTARGYDNEATGSSTGWLTTYWPVEPGEEFELVFHVHDTSDAVFDSAVTLDKFEFLNTVRAGTVPYGTSL